MFFTDSYDYAILVVRIGGIGLTCTPTQTKNNRTDYSLGSGFRSGQ